MFESAFVEQVQIMHEIDILMYSTLAGPSISQISLNVSLHEHTTRV